MLNFRSAFFTDATLETEKRNVPRDKLESCSRCIVSLAHRAPIFPVAANPSSTLSTSSNEKVDLFEPRSSACRKASRTTSDMSPATETAKHALLVETICVNNIKVVMRWGTGTGWGQVKTINLRRVSESIQSPSLPAQKEI